MSKLVSIDGKTGNIIDATVSNNPGTVDARYQAAAGNTLENTRAIESHPYYQWFDTQLYNNHKITPVGTAWQDAADLNIPKGSKASLKTKMEITEHLGLILIMIFMEIQEKHMILMKLILMG